jgi:prephenate dehydrogenase
MRIRRAVVAGGLGEVGRFVAGLLGAESATTLCDTRSDGRRGVLADDIRTPGPALATALAAADAVVLAVSESVAIEAIPAVAAMMRPGAVLVDTLSVKSRVEPALARAAGERGLSALSLNPMFAPSLEPAGRPIAVVEVAPGRAAGRMCELLRAAGAVVVPMTAARHDRLCAAVQVATHASVLAFGDTVRALDADAGDLLAVAPPPHRAMLALLARMVSASPEVYRDIQVANPGARAARATLTRATDRLSDLAATPERFAAHLGQLADWLGPHRAELAAECAAAFKATAPTGSERAGSERAGSERAGSERAGSVPAGSVPGGSAQRG